MPFDIWITRRKSFAECASDDADAPAITRQEFEGLVADAPRMRRRRDGDIWICYPLSGQPWLAARLTKGSIVLSLSFGNHRFLRNWSDAFDLALNMAGPLHAHIFEGPGGKEISEQNLHRMLAAEGPFVKHHRSEWHHFQDKMEQEMLAPLEIPIGDLEATPEFFLLQTRDPLSRSGKSSVDAINALGLALQAQPSSPQCAVVVDTDTGDHLIRVDVKDGVTTLRPFHGKAEFADKAGAVLTLARALESKANMTFTFGPHQRPFFGHLREEIEKRIDNLCVDFFEWHKTLSAEPATK